MASRARRRAALAVALAALAPAPFLPARSTPVDDRPNIVVILTDDQPPGSLPHEPPVMPYLQARMEDPNDHWVVFPNAFVSTPLCCPSRATILTGLYSSHTGVRTNYDGNLLDEGDTLPVWLQRSGYRTGLVGKYLNGYPFGGAPYVPAGWDRWLVKRQGAQDTAFYGYTLVDQGMPVFRGDAPSDYLTDVVAAGAVGFIRSAPADRPFFLMVAPTAPHRPWTPAPWDEGVYADMPIPTHPSIGEADVSDKPAWVRRLPGLAPEGVLRLRQIRRRAFETLHAVDRLVATIEAALQEKGELDETVVFFLTDNGLALGEHRWLGKTCPYEECIRTPFLVRYPGAANRVDHRLVSNVDVAPTIAQLAGVDAGRVFDGLSLVPLLEGSGARWREAAFIEYAGDAKVPPWWGLRTADLTYVEYATGEREVYDLTGLLGPADPFQLDNRLRDPSYAAALVELAAMLERLRDAPPAELP